ncbi:MAG: response regulator [Kiritimatiellales bacterium]|nr:response regulator [Kiritimatiellota bacterium]MBL7012422.1 response regulator [Kiritimatiellales bacterium]
MAHILIIDDDAEIRTALECFLAGAGYSTSQAANGSEGLRLLEKGKIDLVITDIYMPEADGLEVAREIKKRYNQESVQIPVIAVSGGIKFFDATVLCYLQQAKRFGASRTFNKPLDFGAIHEAIQELLAGDSSDRVVPA